MTSLHIVENIFGNGFKSSGLVIITMLSIICGVLVIVSKNPVKSVLFLIGLFLTIAVYLFTLDISFIALAYLLVYVGAVSILFLFILMLINVRVSELITDNNNSIPLSVIIVTVFSIAFSGKSLSTGFLFGEKNASNDNLALLFNSRFNVDKNIITKESFNEYKSLFTDLFFVKETDENIYLVFSSMWDGILAEVSHITSLGNILYTSYTIGIIIVGLILLLSMIGAISITYSPKNN